MTERVAAIADALLAPLLDPGDRTWLPCLLLSVGVAAFVLRGRLSEVPRALGLTAFGRPSARLDLMLLATRQLLGLLWAGPSLGLAWLVGTQVALALDGWLGVPQVPEVPPLALTVGYTLALFVAWDLSRYVLHRCMHEVPALWELHQLHHSADVLTPFTFHRVHPLEGLLYELRGALVGGTCAGLAFWLFRGAAVEWTVLGVHGLGLVANAVSGNLRHSHVWWTWGRLERVLLSPAQHQLHHARDGGDRYNYGTWLACWDRWAGSWRRAPPQAPTAYGLDERNHGDDLVSALVGPVVGLLRRGRRLAAGLLFLGSTARGQEEEEEDVDYEIVVVRPDGVPRVAGSAHVVSEEELDRFGYGDVTKPLQKVPGVYVRGEDGFGLRPNIGMRGGNSDRSAKITLLQDGIPLAPAPYAAPAAYYFPLTARLAGIEVFKGPASIRHGPQTIGGAVNVRTRNVPMGLDAALDSAVGMYDTVRLHGWSGAGDERFGVLIEGAHLSSGGFKQLDTGGPTGFLRQDLMLKARAGTVELLLGYGRESSDETYLGLSLEDFEDDPYRRYAASDLDHMVWDHTEASLRWTHGTGPVQLRAVAYHHWLGRAWTKLNRFAGGPDLHDLLAQPASGQSEVFLGILKGEVDGVGEDQQLLIGTNDRTFANGGAQVAVTHTAGGERVGSELEVGARLHVDDVVRVHTEDPYDMVRGVPLAADGPTTTTLDAHTRAEALATWVAEDLRLGVVHLLPGARVEVIRTSAGTTRTGPVDPVTRSILLPGGGVFVEARPWLDLFAGVHRGFSPVPPGSEVDARPETAWSYEAGFRGHGGETHAELVGFFSDYANLTGQCTLSSGCVDTQLDQQFAGGQAFVYGLEALASHHVGLPGRVGLGGQISYTLTRSSFRTGFYSEFPQWGDVQVGDALPYVPVHQGAATLVADHPRGELAVTGTGRSSMRDVAGQGEIPRPERIPSALILDVAARVVVSEHATATLTVNNATDAVVMESMRPFGARPAAPLTAMVGIELTD